MSVRVTTHVLDTSAGRPAEGVRVVLERAAGDGWELVGQADTGSDGRAGDFAPVAGGRHRLRFGTAAHSAFFPEVIVQFAVGDEDHLHLPLLLNPYGYSTYRGS
jgi:5-hydroxyisourate hydrolase